MKISKLLLIGAALLASNAMAIDASSLKLKVYAVMLSTSSLCTNPVTIFSSVVPTEVDFLVAPTLGSGNPPDGTYNCIIIKMSDIIKFKPLTSSATYCVAGTEYSSDVCRFDNGGTTRAPDVVDAVTGCLGTDASVSLGVITPATPSADIVYMYLTTNATAGTGGGNAFIQPTTIASTDGLNLTAPLIVSGKTRSKFVVNASGKVGEDIPTQSCGMNPPVFGFVKLP